MAEYRTGVGLETWGHHTVDPLNLLQHVIRLTISANVSIVAPYLEYLASAAQDDSRTKTVFGDLGKCANFKQPHFIKTAFSINPSSQNSEWTHVIKKLLKTLNHTLHLFPRLPDAHWKRFLTSAELYSRAQRQDGPSPISTPSVSKRTRTGLSKRVQRMWTTARNQWLAQNDPKGTSIRSWFQVGWTRVHGPASFSECSDRQIKKELLTKPEFKSQTSSLIRIGDVSL